MDNNTKNELRLYELYDIWYEPFWLKPWFIISVTILIAIAVISIVWFFIRYKKKQKKVLMPWQEALKQLDLLENQPYYDSKLHKKLYEEITSILKKYLSRRYGLVLSSKTDDEVILILKSSEFPSSFQPLLEEVFNGALFIKFANHQAVIDQINIDLKRAKELVRQTIPR